jgi:ATP-dependent Clp protease ATP-binding subunit ClpA
MQDAAVAAVSDCVRLSRTGLREHDRPQGVFLFLGPTGVGKTELTKVLESIHGYTMCYTTLRVQLYIELY